MRGFLLGLFLIVFAGCSLAYVAGLGSMNIAHAKDPARVAANEKVALYALIAFCLTLPSGLFIFIRALIRANRGA